MGYNKEEPADRAFQPGTDKCSRCSGLVGLHQHLTDDCFASIAKRLEEIEHVVTVEMSKVAGMPVATVGHKDDVANNKKMLMGWLTANRRESHSQTVSYQIIASLLLVYIDDKEIAELCGDITNAWKEETKDNS